MSKQGATERRREMRKQREQECRRELESAWLTGFFSDARSGYMTYAEARREAREYVDRTSGLPAAKGDRP